ncbi:HD domain-containing protein [Salirhabdus sp. Marseille-P4669]|uniref:HD domain-containing protein n=1 Tax=Salirhabdus sp. Marseille-P4669 TaxID=2042310 RepID=UPI000C7C566A|nr:HD domain-containing protein [Salirhabdus sp. Marseille-P4669]
MVEIQQILQVIKLGERLKKELRHSWLSNGRAESVAEHTWRVSLMAILVEKYLDKSLNMEKLLKMITIHDLIEAKVGDVPAFDTLYDSTVKNAKQQREMQAITEIRDMLPDPLGNEIYRVWMEFEEKSSYEAKVANALDKLEAQIQHNEADFSTWIEIEKEMTFRLGVHTAFDSFLTKLKNEIEKEGAEKLERAGVDISVYTK